MKNKHDDFVEEALPIDAILISHDRRYVLYNHAPATIFRWLAYE